MLRATARFCLDFVGAEANLVADAGGRLYVGPALASGLKATRLTTIDRTRSVGELSFAAVETDQLADDRGTASAWLRDAGRGVLAATRLGAGQDMIEKAVDYAGRSEKRRVGKAGVSTWRSRWTQYA